MFVLVCYDVSYVVAVASVYFRLDRRRYFYLIVRYRYCNRVNRRLIGK